MNNKINIQQDNVDKPPLATSNTNEDGKTPTRPTGMDLSQFVQYFNSLQTTFASDSTIEKITFNISEDKETRKRRNAERRTRLAFTDEQRRAHFEQKLKECDEETDNVLTELHEWRAGFIMWEERTPDTSDYARKKEEIQNELKTLTPRLNPESLFRDGADDTARCGQLLIYMEKEWAGTDKERQAVGHLFSLQWLIRQQAADCVDRPETTDCEEAGEETEETSPAPVVSQKEEDEETTALRKLLVEKLHIPTNGDNSGITFGDKTYSQGQTLASTMSLYRDKNVAWAKTTSKFADKVAPILNRSKESIEKKINRSLSNIKDIPLKNLSEEEIMKRGNSKALAKQIYKEWEGLYPIVLQLSESVPGHKTGQ